MGLALSPEGEGVAHALVAWRRGAIDRLLAATAALHLVAVALAVLGYSPAHSALAKRVGLACYLVMTICAAWRGLDVRVRLATFFAAAYVVVAYSSLIDTGAYSQVALVAHPVFVLVLAGPVAARLATATSAAILVGIPILGTIPAIARALELDPAQVATVTQYRWFRMASLGAFLFTLMMLLDRFHGFLLDTLAAQYRATRSLELEVAERRAAQCRLEDALIERQRLEREMAVITDEERHKLGQDLHDGVCQQMTAALLRCQALQHSAARGQPASAADFAPLTTLLTETIDDAHDVARGLCPLDADPGALAPALRALVRRTQELADVRCEFTSTGEVRVLVPDAAQHLYRIVQEALSNAVRHAHASRIAIELLGTPDRLTLQVEDNGTGLPPGDVAGGLGLRTMASRARMVGGEFEVAPAPGGGTRVTCRVPRVTAGRAGPERAEESRWLPTT